MKIMVLGAWEDIGHRTQDTHLSHLCLFVCLTFIRNDHNKNCNSHSFLPHSTKDRSSALYILLLVTNTNVGAE